MSKTPLAKARTDLFETFSNKLLRRELFLLVLLLLRALCLFRDCALRCLGSRIVDRQVKKASLM